MKATEQGIALLIVLWVMAILTATVFSLSLLTRADTYGTAAFKEDMEKRYLAEAGIERGVTEMIYRNANQGQTIVLEGQEVWRADGTAYYGRLKEGGYAVRIYDEGGKIALNDLTDASGIIVKKLLLNLGSPPEEADTIVDSIMDWKDADDLHRLYGAEDDYYQSLPHPYKARNADFASLEELLLVKGVTPDILYGKEKRKGLMQFLTLYNNGPMVNLNTAPPEVLAALPGLSADQASQIVASRKTAEIRSMEDIRGIIGDAENLPAPFVRGQQGTATVCTIESTGFHDLEKRGYSVRATVAMEGPAKYRYLYYRSPSERIYD